MRRKQAGFTLVEIAIVLVIIGLLLGGVLKGQELINQAKIKNIVNDLTGITAAIYTYQDRYKQLPGDDPNAAARWTTPTWTADAQTAGDGLIGSSALGLSSNVAGDETQLFWQQLRNAGLVAGQINSGTQPQNAVGGILGVREGAGQKSGKAIMGGVVVCETNLPGKVAEAVDVQLDDGVPNSGSVQAFQQTGGPVGVGGADPTQVDNSALTAYVDDSTTLYTVCKSI